MVSSCLFLHPCTFNFYPYCASQFILCSPPTAVICVSRSLSLSSQSLHVPRHDLLQGSFIFRCFFISVSSFSLLRRFSHCIKLLIWFNFLLTSIQMDFVRNHTCHVAISWHIWTVELFGFEERGNPLRAFGHLNWIPAEYGKGSWFL